MTTKCNCMSAAVLAAIMVSPWAIAADLPKEGSYDFVSCFTGTSNTVTFSKTHWASTTELTGTSQTNPPGGLYDKVSFRCLSMDVTVDGKTTATSMCEGIDKDGDKYLSHFVNDGQKTTRSVVAGTGKYDGLTSSGTTKNMGPFPSLKPGTVQNCIQQTGTYKMK
jgi:hypothetical protein